MFRECYFEYAGQSSQPYNLMLCYVSNSNTDFDSGGGFDLKTDTLPRSHETLLYGKDYSAKPLEFDVEFMNLHGYIPMEQMIEIKNWLFGQDGWKTFKCLDDRQDYLLKCTFEPGEDIVDGTGYRGIRCTLKNASPFWYGSQKEVTISDLHTGEVTLSGNPYNAYKIYIPENECAFDELFVTCEFTVGAISSAKDFKIENTQASTVVEAKEIYHGIRFNATSKTEAGFTVPTITLSEGMNSAITLDTKNATVKIEGTDTLLPITFDNLESIKPFLTLNKGINIVRFRSFSEIQQIKIRYTPIYRMGAF